jgi:hypothetical protein
MKARAYSGGFIEHCLTLPKGRDEPLRTAVLDARLQLRLQNCEQKITRMCIIADLPQV